MSRTQRIYTAREFVVVLVFNYAIVSAVRLCIGVAFNFKTTIVIQPVLEFNITQHHSLNFIDVMVFEFHLILVYVNNTFTLPTPSFNHGYIEFIFFGLDECLGNTFTFNDIFNHTNHAIACDVITLEIYKEFESRFSNKTRPLICSGGLRRGLYSG
jgi:hypothetical protein